MVWVSLVSIVIAGLYLYNETYRSDSLLTHATRVTGPRKTASQYFWLSDHEILTFIRGGKPTAVRLDIRTGMEVLMPALTNTFEGIGEAGNKTLSPDGKWLLWSAEYKGAHPGPPFPSAVVASSVTGDRIVDRRPGSNLIWLPDSRHWARYYPLSPGSNPSGLGQVEVQLHDRGSTKMTRCSIRSIPELLVGPNKNICTLAGSHVIGALDQNKLLAASSYEERGRVHLFEVDWNEPKKSRRYVVRFNDSRNVRTIILSPDRKRLAWVFLSFGFDSPLMEFLSRRAPWLIKGPSPQMVIATSDVDGGRFREIGSDRHVPGPFDFSWTPDSRHLSFYYQKCLYAVPAPQ